MAQRLPVYACLAVSSLVLSACANPSLSPTSSPATVTSTMAAETERAGIVPLGDADLERKTVRPQASSQLVVSDVRVGKHDGFERVVFELEGSGKPGWFIEYTDDPAQQGSGNSIKYEGNTALEVFIDGTVYPFEIGEEVEPLGTTSGVGGTVTEVISSGTFEGHTQFTVGMKERHPFSVQVLEEPTRVVIDIVPVG